MTHVSESTQRIEEIAQTILRYLRRRPSASDSLDGIHRWWMREQRYADSLQDVGRAVEFLLERHALEKSGGGSTPEIFHLPDKRGPT